MSIVFGKVCVQCRCPQANFILLSVRPLPTAVACEDPWPVLLLLKTHLGP